MSKKGSKIPEYTRRAIAKYQAKFDRTNINLPKGLKDQVKAVTGDSLSGFAIRLMMEELERLGHPYTPPEDDNEDS